MFHLKINPDEKSGLSNYCQTKCGGANGPALPDRCVRNRQRFEFCGGGSTPSTSCATLRLTYMRRACSPSNAGSGSRRTPADDPAASRAVGAHHGLLEKIITIELTHSITIAILHLKRHPSASVTSALSGGDSSESPVLRAHLTTFQSLGVRDERQKSHASCCNQKPRRPLPFRCAARPHSRCSLPL
jgi:hypothetical protein